MRASSRNPIREPALQSRVERDPERPHRGGPGCVEFALLVLHRGVADESRGFPAGTDRELDRLGGVPLRRPEILLMQCGVAQRCQSHEDGAAEIAELEERLAEMESQGAAEVAELQRAQESLVNTQVELLETARKLHPAEERVPEIDARSGEPVTASSEAPAPAKADAEWEAFGRPALEPPPSRAE